MIWICWYHSVKDTQKPGALMCKDGDNQLASIYHESDKLCALLNVSTHALQNCMQGSTALPSSLVCVCMFVCVACNICFLLYYDSSYDIWKSVSLLSSVCVCTCAHNIIISISSSSMVSGGWGGRVFQSVTRSSSTRRTMLRST